MSSCIFLLVQTTRRKLKKKRWNGSHFTSFYLCSCVFRINIHMSSSADPHFGENFRKLSTSFSDKMSSQGLEYSRSPPSSTRGLSSYIKMVVPVSAADLLLWESRGSLFLMPGNIGEKCSTISWIKGKRIEEIKKVTFQYQYQLSWAVNPVHQGTQPEIRWAVVLKRK